MSDTSLFRAAALEAQRIQSHGDIVMSQPMTYKVLAVIAALMGSALIVFAYFGSYTKRTTVIGQVMPNSGLVKLYVQQPGIVVEEHVVEGKPVEKDDILFVLSSERKSSTMGETQAAITEQARLRQRSLREQLLKTKQLASLEQDALQARIAALQQELPKLEALIDGQKHRIELAEQGFERYGQLSKEGYVTQDQLIQKQAELLDQRARLENLERERIVTSRNLNDAENQLEALPIKYDNQLAEISRGIANTEQELSESEARRRLVVIATESGIATAITARKGQVVDGSKPLVSIIPKGAELQAHLYAPTRAVGFIRPGDVVRIRYQAFPFQKFGQYTGKVSTVATTALTSAELTGSNVFAGGGPTGGEPLYRIAVTLDSQTITAYGNPMPLQAGMLLDADILQETRRLYEWILEPLYSLSGKL